MLTRLKLDGLVNKAAMNLLGAGELFTTGNVYYVDSVNGSNGSLGTDPAFPKASIDNANNSTTATRGDIIVAMPGHVETVSAAAGLELDIAGVTVLGLGSGDARPQVNFTTVVGADMNIGADDVSVVNVRFTGGFDALTGPIDVNADDFSLLGCKYEDVTGQTVDCIVINAVNGSHINNLEWRGAAAAGGQSAIQLTDADEVIIENFLIDGNLAAGCIESVTTNCLNLTIREGYLRTRNAADLAITLQATDTGNIGPFLYIRLQDNAANITECITIDNDCQIFDPIYVCNLNAERGLQYNGTASTDA